MPDWIAYYDDESSYSSDQYSPFDIPRIGCQMVVQRNERTGYDRLNTVGDYFVYDPDRGGWRMVEWMGLALYLITCRHPCVIFGLNMADDRFDALVRKIEQEIGPKSGWLPREKRR